MLGTILRYLVDHGLTTIQEIGEVTGRSSSTVYRWMNGESQPPFMDMRVLVRHMKNQEARRTMVSLLTADLPLVVKWIPEPNPEWTLEDEAGKRHDGHEIMDRTLLALDCLSDAMNAGHQAIRKKELSEQTYAELIRMLDETIRHLTTSRMMLQKYAPAKEDHGRRTA